MPRSTRAVSRSSKARRCATSCAPFGSLADWDAFADSWNRLELDTYMADGGRYRRRRHATFAAGADGAIARKPHQPHFQSLDYNPLHGGIARWFEPVEEADRRGLEPARFSSSAGRVRQPGAGIDAMARRSAPVPHRGAPRRAGGRRPKDCTATASTTCWCCSSTGRTSPAA